jgi:hypothetical protein
MKKLRVGLAAGLAALAVLPTGAHALSSPKHYINAAGFGSDVRPAYRPRRLLEITGDGTAFLDHIVWHNWNKPVATATARVHEDDCIPDCAEGHFTTHRTRLRAFRPRLCAAKSKILYTRMTIRGVRIGGSRVLRFSNQGC